MSLEGLRAPAQRQKPPAPETLTTREEAPLERLEELRAQYQSLKESFRPNVPWTEGLKSPLRNIKARRYIESLRSSSELVGKALADPVARAETLGFLSEFRPERRYDKSWTKFNEGIVGAVAHIGRENLAAVRPNWEQDEPAAIGASVQVLETALKEAAQHPKSKKHQAALETLSEAIASELARAQELAPTLLKDEAGRTKLQYAGSLVGSSFEHGDENAREKARTLFLSLLMEKSAASEEYQPTAGERALSERGNVNSIKTIEYGGLMTAALARIVNSSFEYTLDKPTAEDSPARIDANKTLRPALEKIGLDPAPFMQSARQTIDGDLNGKEELLRSINTAWNIETERPGAVKELSTTFGIQSYGRYAPEVLVRQYDERESMTPYGIVMYPQGDHNGAFTRGSTRQMFTGLSENAHEQGYALRIYETGSPFGAVKHLMEADKKYGSSNKISFALVGGHGNARALNFGGKKRIAQRGVEAGEERLKELFVEKPTVIFDSCLVGSDGGLGETFSKIYGAKVLAADTSINGIDHVNFKPAPDGTLEFDVAYRNYDSDTTDQAPRRFG